MNDYQERFAARVRAAAGDAVEQVIAAAPPVDSYDGFNDLIGAALYASNAAAAAVWADSILRGDHQPPPAPPQAAAVQVAGGLLIRPADYRGAP